MKITDIRWTPAFIPIEAPLRAAGRGRRGSDTVALLLLPLPEHTDKRRGGGRTDQKTSFLLCNLGCLNRVEKRSENLKAVPVSISVLSGAVLNSRAISNLDE